MRQAAERTVTAWQVTHRSPRAFPPDAFPSRTGSQLRVALAREHAQRPFSPRDVRAATQRVAEVAGQLGFQAVVVRGGLDVGGAELDHLWVAVEGRVVDVTMPVSSEAFVQLLRAYIAGDRTAEDLDRAAHGYALEARVLGSYPERLRYLGLPVWGSRAAGRG